MIWIRSHTGRVHAARKTILRPDEAAAQTYCGMALRGIAIEKPPKLGRCANCEAALAAIESRRAKVCRHGAGTPDEGLQGDGIRPGMDGPRPVESRIPHGAGAGAIGCVDRGPGTDHDAR